MKTINKINYIMMSIPILLMLLGKYDESLYFYLQFSLIQLGLFQVGVK